MSAVFSYWKRPWHKWVVLIGGVSQLVALWLNIREYRNLSSVQERVFSTTEWEQIAAQKLLQCSISSLLAATLFGALIISHFAHNKKAARNADGILCVVLGLAWGAAGLLFPIRYTTGDTIIWLIILLLTLGGGIIAIRQNACKSRTTAIT